MHRLVNCSGVGRPWPTGAGAGGGGGSSGSGAPNAASCTWAGPLLAATAPIPAAAPPMTANAAALITTDFMDPPSMPMNVPDAGQCPAAWMSCIADARESTQLPWLMNVMFCVAGVVILGPETTTSAVTEPAAPGA